MQTVDRVLPTNILLITEGEMTSDKRAIGVFPNYRDTEIALRELKNSGFSMEKVSVIVRDGDRHDDIAGVEVEAAEGNQADQGATAGAVTGGALGGLTGLLVGLGTLAIPGVGPILLAGVEATAIATTLAGGAIGATAGGILGALVGLGIPEEKAKMYSDRVSQGDYLVIVEGSESEVNRAASILSSRGIREWGVFDNTSEVVSATAVQTTQATPSNQTTNLNSGLYSYAAGILPGRVTTEQTIVEIVNSGISPSQISVIATEVKSVKSVAGVEMSTRVDNYSSLGISDERSRVYAKQVALGEYLVIVRGTDADIRRAQTILNNQEVKEFGIYNPSPANNPSPVNDIQSKSSSTTGDPEVILIDKRK